MIVTAHRFAGGTKDTPDPLIKLFNDGKEVPDAEGKLLIAGRDDVKPAVERTKAMAKQLFDVELHLIYRNHWSSDPNAAKPVKKPRATKAKKTGRK